MNDIARIRSVEVGVPFVVSLILADGRRLHADLTGFVHRTPAFRRFLDDPEAFRRVTVEDWGYTLEWENGLDMPLPNLVAIAEEQEVSTGADLARFVSANKLSEAETADLLGTTARTVRNYKAHPDKPLPKPVQISLRTFERNPLTLAAHFHPRKAGRPRGVVTE